MTVRAVLVKAGVLGLACAGLGVVAAPPTTAAEPDAVSPEHWVHVAYVAGDNPSSTAARSDLAAMSDQGAFRLWFGHGLATVSSTTDLTEQGLQLPTWQYAPTMAFDPARGAYATSDSGNFLVLARPHAEEGANGPTIDVQAVDAGSPRARPLRTISMRRTRDLATPQISVAVAATGSRIYLVGVSGSGSTSTQQIQLFRSSDRGTTWSAPVELTGRAPAGARPGVPTPRIVADGPHVAIVLSEPDADRPEGRRTILRSDDGGATWATLDDPDPAATGSLVGLGWRDDELRAAWVTVSADTGRLRTSTAAASATWSSPETLPDELAATAVYTTPVVRRIGSVWGVQADGGQLRTRWPSGWLAPNIGSTQRPPGAGRYALLYGDEAFVLDIRPPVVRSYWPSFTAYQLPSSNVGLIASDEGRLRSTECWFDDVTPAQITPDNPYCYSPHGPLSEGPHSLRMVAVDQQGATTERTLRWTVDASDPVVHWRAPPRWTRAGHVVRWSWRTSDAISGVHGTWTQLDSGTRHTGVDLLRVRRGPGRLAVVVPAGSTTCAVVEAQDLVANFTSERRCTTAFTDDADLAATADARLRSARSFSHGAATDLSRRGAALRATVSSQRRVTGLAVRVLTCPTCGTLLVGVGAQRRVVDLRSSTRQVRTLEVPLTGARPGRDVRVAHGPRGRVVVDGLYVETAGRYGS